MCGRLSQSRYQDYLRLCEVGEGGRPVRVPPPRFNVAPSLELLACRMGADGRRELAPLVWGLVPRWVKDPGKVPHPINARAESLGEKPMFRHAFQQGCRCIVPADGFYEWRREGKRRQPFFIRLRSGAPMALAGLWDHWQGESGAIESCTLIVGPANELVAPLHDRMPIILRPADFGRWLDGKAGIGELQTLLVPYAAAELEAFPVSPAVNDPRHEGAALILPAEPPASPPPEPQGELF